jgi:hypothetical protein
MTTLSIRSPCGSNAAIAARARPAIWFWSMKSLPALTARAHRSVIAADIRVGRTPVSTTSTRAPARMSGSTSKPARRSTAIASASRLSQVHSGMQSSRTLPTTTLRCGSHDPPEKRRVTKPCGTPTRGRRGAAALVGWLAEEARWVVDRAASAVEDRADCAPAMAVKLELVAAPHIAWDQPFDGASVRVLQGDERAEPHSLEGCRRGRHGGNGRSGGRRCRPHEEMLRQGRMDQSGSRIESGMTRPRLGVESREGRPPSRG